MKLSQFQKGYLVGVITMAVGRIIFDILTM